MKIIRGNYEGETVLINKLESDNSYWVKSLNKNCYFIVNEQDLEPYTKPRWTFIDDEKVILRNLPKEWRFVARDECGLLALYQERPCKAETFWEDAGFITLNIYSHLFQSIKWEDNEPCEFRKYI